MERSQVPRTCLCRELRSERVRRFLKNTVALEQAVRGEYVETGLAIPGSDGPTSEVRLRERLVNNELLARQVLTAIEEVLALHQAGDDYAIVVQRIAR